MFGMNFNKKIPLPAAANKESVGIDLSGDNLRLVYARVSPHRTEVVKLLSRDISNLSDDKISEVISAAFSELKLKNPDVVNIIPSHSVISKNIEIPSTDPEEIKEIIGLQAGRHTPYSREEVITDYIDISTYKRNYTKILLIIVAQDIIKKQFDILSRAGVRSDKVVLLPESLAWFVPRVLKLKTEDSPISVIHIDEKFSDFTVVFKNKPVFIRNIPIGTQNMTGEEGYRLKFMDEVKRSLEAYQSEDIEKTPNMLVITGAIEDLKDLETILNENMHLPVRMVYYLQNLIISDRALKAASEAKRMSFLNVIAPLLAGEELKVNLIPEEVKLRKSLEKRGRELIKTGILILTIFVFVFFALISNIYFTTAHLGALDKKYQSLDIEAKKLEGDFTRVNLIKNYLLSRGYSLEVLTELYDAAPLDLKLNDIRFDMQGKFSVKGTAESMSTVFSFVDNMENSQYFKEVKTRYTTKRKDGLKDVTDFEIVSMLEEEAD